MLLNERYKFIDQDGEDHLPSERELKAWRLEGKTPIAVLDTMVCLNIINLVDGKSLPTPQLHKTQHLLTYFKIHDLSFDVLGSFGVMELCVNKRTFEINKEKFCQTGGKLKYALTLDPYTVVARNFQPELITNSETEIQQYHNVVGPLVTLSYCNLLKIREIARRHRKAFSAERAIEEYYEWMDKKINCICGSELQLALMIIGDKMCQEMIALDNPNTAKAKIINTILGTAWDLYHHRTICTYSNAIAIEGVRYKTLFVTEDANLSALLKGVKLESVEKDGDHIKTTKHSTEREYKNLGDLFLNKLQERSIRRCLEKLFYGDKGTDMDLINQEIKNLEELIL
jgi:hypothetical protein